MTAQDVIERLSAAAATYHGAQELAALAPVWDPVASTDEALKDCVFENCMGAVIGVRRRQRPGALSAAITAAFEGYMTARYLLGSGSAQPRYSRDANEVAVNADRIDQQMTSFSRDNVMRALDCGNRELINRVALTQARFPLRDMMRMEKADALFLTAYCLGMAAAMAEEQLFGPLGWNHLQPVAIRDLPSARRPVRR